MYIYIYRLRFRKDKYRFEQIPRFDESFELVEGFRIYDLSFEDSFITVNFLFLT